MLIIANFLLTLTPLFLFGLTSNSVFSLTFVRFFIAGIIELILLILLIYLEFYQRRKTISQKNQEISEEFTFIRLIRFYFFEYVFSKNDKMNSKPHLLSYYTLLGGLLVAFSIPFNYWGFQTFGVVFTTMSVNGITLLFISFNNLYKREEDFNLLYLGYFILIISSIFTSSIGRESEAIQFSIEGTISLFISITTWISFLIVASKSTNTPIKSMKSALKVKINNNIIFSDRFGLHQDSKSILPKLIRSILQLFYIHVIGSLLLYPLTYFLMIMLPESNISLQATQFLFIEAETFITLFFDYRILIIAIFSTVIPYLLIFISASNWPKHALKHDQWNSILTLIEPLMGLYIGLFVWKEQIKTDYVIITTILLVSSILIRYFYENGTKIEFIIFLKIDTTNINQLEKLLSKYKKEIGRISVLCGVWDIIINGTCRSIKKFNDIYNILEENNIIKKIKHSIVEKVHER
jgi:hypothetical protein